jgi:hypothetical protein
MRMSVFKRLLIIEEEKEMNKLNVGDYFLYGKSIITQRENKKPGQPITYYEIIRKSHNNIEYAPIYDYMEKDKGEEIK